MSLGCGLGATAFLLEAVSREEAVSAARSSPGAQEYKGRHLLPPPEPPTPGRNLYFKN